MNHHVEDGAAHVRRIANAVEALYATGHGLLSRDRFSEAACVCRAMLAFAPSDERGWLALGACHEGMGQRDLALQLYAVGSALIGGGVRCDIARSRLLHVTGKFEQAEEAMIRARHRADTIDDQELSALLHAEGRLS